MPTAAERTVSVVVGLIGGGLFGGISVALRAADEWSGLTRELVSGAVFLSLIVLSIVVAGLGGSSLIAAMSAAAACAGLGMAWSRAHRDGSQIGLNLAMGVFIGVVYALAIIVARRREERRSTAVRADHDEP